MKWRLDQTTIQDEFKSCLLLRPRRCTIPPCPTSIICVCTYVHYVLLVTDSLVIDELNVHYIGPSTIYSATNSVSGRPIHYFDSKENEPLIGRRSTVYPELAHWLHSAPPTSAFHFHWLYCEWQANVSALSLQPPTNATGTAATGCTNARMLPWLEY